MKTMRLLVGLLFFCLGAAYAQETIMLPTVAQLQASPGSKNRMAVVTSTAAPGMYYWDETSTLTANGTSIIQVTGVTTGRWILQDFGHQNASQVQTAIATTPSYPKLLYSNTSVPAGNTITGSTVEQFFASQYNLPAGTLKAVDYLQIRINGIFSSPAVAPSIRGRVYIGNTLINDTGFVTSVAGVTNGAWWGTGDYTLFSIGATGSIMPQANLTFQSAATATLNVPIPATTAASLDTTVDNLVRISITCSGNSAGSYTLQQFHVLLFRQ